VGGGKNKQNPSGERILSSWGPEKKGDIFCFRETSIKKKRKRGQYRGKGGGWGFEAPKVGLAERSSGIREFAHGTERLTIGGGGFVRGAFLQDRKWEQKQFQTKLVRLRGKEFLSSGVGAKRWWWGGKRKSNHAENKGENFGWGGGF